MVVLRKPCPVRTVPSNAPLAATAAALACGEAAAGSGQQNLGGSRSEATGERLVRLEALGLEFTRFHRLTQELTLLANNFLSTYAFMAPPLQTLLDARDRLPTFTFV